ncbi:hypothetical protein GCM10022232_63950 [Streptomyces plumbiresistens]|uniref:Uncharacterized protein n=1 Tax=Streptomyces plumbiresistens TaxID=511811 RepID=A0ABP7SKG0_9ACTN
MGRAVGAVGDPSGAPETGQARAQVVMEFSTLSDYQGLVPLLPSCLLEPLRDQFTALLPEHVDADPLG